MKEERKEVFPPKPTEYELIIGKVRVLIQEEGRSRFETGDKTRDQT